MRSKKTSYRTSYIIATIFCISLDLREAGNNELTDPESVEHVIEVHFHPYLTIHHFQNYLLNEIYKPNSMGFLVTLGNEH